MANGSAYNNIRVLELLKQFDFSQRGDGNALFVMSLEFTIIESLLEAGRKFYNMRDA